ncbi:hypothetical protein BC828DRAFT_400311 [Blastocladiella britannica]|nr:hypothetical protein BC828DRAFT_400311 [Blastocladiella britannica]
MPSAIFHSLTKKTDHSSWQSFLDETEVLDDVSTTLSDGTKYIGALHATRVGALALYQPISRPGPSHHKVSFALTRDPSIRGRISRGNRPTPLKGSYYEHFTFIDSVAVHASKMLVWPVYLPGDAPIPCTDLEVVVVPAPVCPVREPVVSMGLWQPPPPLTIPLAVKVALVFVALAWIVDIITLLRNSNEEAPATNSRQVCDVARDTSGLFSVALT